MTFCLNYFFEPNVSYKLYMIHFDIDLFKDVFIHSKSPAININSWIFGQISIYTTVYPYQFHFEYFEKNS